MYYCMRYSYEYCYHHFVECTVIIIFFQNDSIVIKKFSQLILDQLKNKLSSLILITLRIDNIHYPTLPTGS